MLCKLCKSRRFHSAFLGKVVDAPVFIQRQVLGVGQCRKTVEVPLLQSVQFLEIVVTVPVLVQTVQKFVEILQFWTKLLGCPLVCNFLGFLSRAANCGASAVAAHRQVLFTCLSLCSYWCRWSRQCSCMDMKCVDSSLWRL